MPTARPNPDRPERCWRLRPVGLVLGLCLLVAFGLPVAYLVADARRAPEPVRSVGTLVDSPPPATTTVPPAGAVLPPSSAAPSPVDPDPPVRLRIAAIEVDAPVDAEGVRTDGVMQIPADGDRVGWYRFGPAPGDAAGSAVLAGHVDTRSGALGVLFRLRTLDVGDRIEVTTSAGRRLAYRVTGRQAILRTRLPDALFARDGAPRLALITCGGPYDKTRWGGYRDNVVVVAEPLR